VRRADGDRFDLDRFVRAQQGVHDVALDELRRGRKTSHWMWFVFPQLLGLGRSSTAQHYGVDGLAEARAYLAHPVLGPRLVTAAEVAAAAPARSVDALLGGVDAMKLRSSMTLFVRAAADPTPFRAVLDRWFAGSEDPVTVRLLDDVD
jgi:uncharacterized protein (DUF1810 family)